MITNPEKGVESWIMLVTWLVVFQENPEKGVESCQVCCQRCEEEVVNPEKGVERRRCGDVEDLLLAGIPKRELKDPPYPSYPLYTSPNPEKGVESLYAPELVRS